MRILSKLFLLTSGIFISIAVFAQAGQLDSTFSKNGKVITRSNGIAQANAIAVQKDGKIITAGTLITNRDVKAMIVRYKKNGSLDKSFGNNGIDTFFIGEEFGNIKAVAVSPNGKIVIAGNGTLDDPYKLRTIIFRLNKNGSLDSSFNNTGGIYIPEFAGTNGLAIQPDGKIIINGMGGKLGSGCFLVARYNTDGSFDTGFNHTGVASVPSLYETFPYGMKLQADGKIVVCGIYNSNASEGLPPNYTGALARYNINGTIDSSFATNGFFYYPHKTVSDNDIWLLSIDQQSNGKLVTCGIRRSIRFNENGNIDSSFGIDGSISSPSIAIAVQSDDKVVTAGNGMKRYTKDGILDNSFGINKDGIVTSPFDLHPGFGTAVCISNNRIYLAGTIDSGFAVAAYLKEDAAVLPVTLLKFTAQKQNNTTLLNWQTADEINNSYFSIERSSDSKTFSSIGTKKAVNSSGINKYSFSDNSPLSGTSYYRLKQVDKDGKYTYSQIISVDFVRDAPGFAVFPNPASNAINIYLPANDDASEIVLYDVNGKAVTREQIAANITSKKINISKLTPGVYNVVLMHNGKKEIIRLLKN